MARLGLAIGVAVLAVATAAHADPEPRILGVTGTFSDPTGDYRDTAGPGGGGGFRLRVPLSPTVEVTASVAAIAHQSVQLTDPPATYQLIEVPLLAGARYYVTGPPVDAHLRTPWKFRTYFAGEVGLVFRRADATTTGSAIKDSDSTIVFGSSLGIGFSYGPFDVSAAAWLSDLSALDHSVAATVTVGWDFATW